MSEKLRKLYATMMQIETKGANTLMLADCIRYVEGLIADAEAPKVTVSESEGE